LTGPKRNFIEAGLDHEKPKILLLYYSMYGHIFELAKKNKEGLEEAGARWSCSGLPNWCGKNNG
jgi:hypothetical protein